MLRRVDEIPNEPDQFAAVIAHRVIVFQFGPNRGKVGLIPVKYFALSGRFASPDREDIEKAPITWKLIQGVFCQDDDDSPRLEDWIGEHVVVPAKVRNARRHLEKALAFLEDHEWYIWDTKESHPLKLIDDPKVRKMFFRASDGPEAT